MVEPIAIIGSGCRFPGGADTPSKLWDVISKPRDLSKKPPADRFNIDAFYHPVGSHHGTTNATQSYWLEDSDRVNVTHFDANFFNTQPAEADTMDPQQRLLMETVYDSLCAAGQPMEKLRGTDTAVYVGSMCDDYNTMITRDWETLGTYVATGLERGILANRVSYFFDFRGPSVSVDTACSSSLVALDYAVQTIRSGRSKVAVAAGTSLILSPAMYISESNLGMLSPSGRCAMWDVKADGYTRGEGVAAVILKPLSQAIADNDPIECVIRETTVNSDGHSATGLTVPSNIAQTRLIRECYERAGLDPINKPADRPQFFQAHGTGTQAGDPQEAEAVQNALFPADSPASLSADKLLIGSIKTVIGHTEGTAGLASVLATSQALRHGIVPPNLHFDELNPKVAPFYQHLQIPTAAEPWPVSEGQVMRASVNSFGFGGTNAHCILEAHSADERQSTPTGTLFTPLTFSANSERALRATLGQTLDYLKANQEINLTDLAYTLQHRRSVFPYRHYVPAPTVDEAISTIEGILQPSDKQANGLDLGKRHTTLSRPAKIMGIFTGQGAQWPRMGAELLESSPYAASRIADLDAALQALSPVDRPTWTLRDQLLAGKETSRVAEAALSQPLCTAVQVLLVDILRQAGIVLTAVVGHSSGEIGAAYAAGLVTAQEAIRIAYFRGVHAKLATSTSTHKPVGAMMAVGASVEEAWALCRQEQFDGRIRVAAVNSGSSVTLSGDSDAIDEAEELLKTQSIFARKLKVDTAYHSAHMDACAGPYLESLDTYGSQRLDGDQNTVWYSSVYGGRQMANDILTHQYWVDNMCGTVLFADALAKALQEQENFDLAIELGPHPALKGPATSTLNTTTSIPYTGLLSRAQSDVASLSTALGYVWAELGYESVQFADVEAMLTGERSVRVLTDLPPYPFDHQRSFWISARIPNHFKHRSTLHVTNPVLGNPCSEANTPGEFQWRKILQPSALPWLKGHMLQGQTVFPATGYVSMAVEALAAVAREANLDTQVKLLKLQDIEIGRAVAFNDDSTTVEVIFSITSVTVDAESASAAWACYSVVEGAGNAVLNAKGRIAAEIGPTEADSLIPVKSSHYNMTPVDEDRFYGKLSKIGYDYAPPFRGLSDIHRKLGSSTGKLTDQSESGWDNDLIVHPGMLDSALQTVFAAWSFPGDTSIWSLHVPVSFSAITINPHFTRLGSGGKQTSFNFESSIRSQEPTEVVGDIYLTTTDDSHAFLQVEGAALVPFSPATPRNDLPMFSRFRYETATPDGERAGAGEVLSAYEIQLYKDVDRVAYWFARNASQEIPAEQRGSLLPHYQNYLKWCDLMVGKISRGENPKVPAESDNDTLADIYRILENYEDRKDVRFVQVVGENLISTIRTGNSMLEHMNQDGLLRAFYEESAICSGPTGRWLSRIVAQISHRFPDLNIFEVGAGTGATTSAVLRELQGAYASYTFTDISSGFFIAAEERFGAEAARMDFKTFNMEKVPSGQGFTEGIYDVAVAVNVLHVSSDLQASLSNIRRLIKPGGFLVVAELTSTDLLFSGMTVGTLPGWWIGAETGRPWGPLLTLKQWDETLKLSGFAGIDTVSPDISSSLPMSVYVAQAVDDRVSLLRNPLGTAERPAGIRNDGLAIIGGTTEEVQRFATDVSEVLSHSFHGKRFFKTVEDFASSDMVTAPTINDPISVLCLTDLDTPFLQDCTSSKLEALKILWSVAGTVVWVTNDSRQGNPYSYMMLGITHTIVTEHPHLSVQLFDLEATNESKVGIQASSARDIATTLLRQHALHEWAPTPSELLWSAEPEVFTSEGTQLVTRLVPDTEANARYNSRRRGVTTVADASAQKIELLADSTQSNTPLQIHTVSPLDREAAAPADHRRVAVKTSLLQTVAVEGIGFLRPSVVRDLDSGDLVLALVGSNRSSCAVPRQWCTRISEPVDASKLVLTAANLLADRILEVMSESGSLLVHEAEPLVRHALRTKSTSAGVKVAFSTTNLSSEDDKPVIFLRPNLPQRVVRSALPNDVSVFVDFSQSNAAISVRKSIEQCLPSVCLKLGSSALLADDVSMLNGTRNPTNYAALLRASWASADAPASISRPNVSSLSQVSGRPATQQTLSVVDWTQDELVEAKVQPIDAGALFGPDRTYLFVGMAGELGQSLAQWMIVHGARNVVLTSRNPKVTPAFVRDMHAQYGAVVKGISLDITSRESLQAALKLVAAELPPIAGIVNGAMILEDELFANMSFESFSKVTAPKVIGTQLLDEAFHEDTSLDFFVVASSIASIIGWLGQSNYSAANEYMTSLVANRRRRGVPGSAMNIPAVAGVGYAAHADNFDFDYFESLGYINISEEDLHALFAEAILSGRPGADNKRPSQICMGVNYVPADLEVKAAHKRDIKFSHFVAHEEKVADANAGKAGVRVKVQLQSAKTADEAYKIISDGFVAHLKRMLRITEDEKMDDVVPLTDQGVDSLVAVDIRSWFLKELGVDIPTLKILGGNSIADLANAALEKIPELSGGAAVPQADEPVAKPQLPELSVQPSGQQTPALVNTTTNSSSSSGSPVFSPAGRSGDSGATTPSAESVDLDTKKTDTVVQVAEVDASLD